MNKDKKITSQVYIADRFIIGWVCDPFQSDLTLLLKQGEHVLASVSCDCWLNELEQIETGLTELTACGFRVPIPESLLTGETHALNLMVENWKLPNDPKPLFFSFTAPKAWQIADNSSTSENIKLLGHVETVDADYIEGFALDLNQPNRMLHVLLLVDNLPIMRIRPNYVNLAVAKRLGVSEKSVGIWGFKVSTPIALKDGNFHTIKLICQETGAVLNDGEREIHFKFVGKVLSSPSLAYKPLISLMQAPVVSIIVLNRNGAVPLKALLDSWYQHNRLPVEWIVVDHASTDDSRTLLHDCSVRMPIQVIALDHNNSFSASCNLGAAQAKTPYLLFLNNDIVWLQDALPKMVSSLVTQPEVGFVGLKLITKDEGWMEEVQHLGIGVALHGNQFWPYEISPLTDNDCYMHAEQVYVGVTGAVMLCRKTDFDMLNGFDERYFYGFEDVDISLRMMRDLGKKNLCRNDLVALHMHGYTRLTGRERKVFDRQVHNASLLEKDWGLWLKQVVRQKRFAHDAVWGAEELVFVVLLDEPNSEYGQHQFQQAAQLINTLNQRDGQLRWLFVQSYEDISQLRGVDVLFVFSELADIRMMQGLAADSIKIAVQSKTQTSLMWHHQPWWAVFDDHILLEDMLSSVDFYWQRWSEQLRVCIHLPIKRADCGQQSVISFAVQGLIERLRTQGVAVRAYAFDEWSKRDFVYDVLVQIYVEDERYLMQAIPDAVNVLWALDAPIGLSNDVLNRFDVLWQASEQLPMSELKIPTLTCFPWVKSQLSCNNLSKHAKLKTSCEIDCRSLTMIDNVVDKPNHYAPSLGRWPNLQRAIYKHLNLRLSAENSVQGYRSYWIGCAIEEKMSISLNDVLLTGVLQQANPEVLVTRLKQLVEQRCGYSVYSS
jgi:GT2 family glycosyltransferase